jgi:hypothetical protein
MGTEIGDSALVAVAWCAGLALAGYLWARAAFNLAGELEQPRPRRPGAAA